MVQKINNIIEIKSERIIISQKKISLVKAVNKLIKQRKHEKSKTLIILSLDRKQKYLDFWKKKLSWNKAVHYIGFQFVDLDEDEYELLKPFEKKLSTKSSKLQTKLRNDFHSDLNNF